jgi:hypothetical protein
LLHELAKELRVHAVDAENDEFVILTHVCGALAGKLRNSQQ